MPRAILKNGVIVPLEPLPAEWAEGTEVELEKVADSDEEDIDLWYERMEKLCAEGDPEDDERLRKAIEEVQREGKEAMRRKMGLP